MAKEKSKTLRVTVLADEIVFDGKTHKQGEEFTMNLQDPVSEGLIAGGAVLETKEFKKRQAELDEHLKEQAEMSKAAEEKLKEKGDGDGSR